MRRAIILVLLLVLATSEPLRADSRTDELATLINRARVERDLLPLARSAELDAAAEAHSRDMVAGNFLDHTGSDGSQPQERAARHGYRVPAQSGWIVVGVISAISGEPAGPLDWWLNESPAVHGRVLLDPRWREFGVGYAAGGEYGNYWTVLVGCRPGVVPRVTFEERVYEHSEGCGDPDTAVTALSVSPSAALSGSEIEVRWSGIAEPSERDWLGLYRAGDRAGMYLAWEYVSCGSAPLVARANGWCWLRVPPSLADGSYEVRLHARDSNERISQAALVAVSGGSARTQP
jgi:hypothetical protein